MNRCTKARAVACALLSMTLTIACMNAGAGRVKLTSGAERIEVVRDRAAVEQCLPLREISVSDGIIRRQRTRVHKGYRDRAYVRLRNVAARKSGDTVLITSESSTVIPDPPTFRWTIEGIVYQCALPTTE